MINKKSGNNTNGRRWEVYRFELVFFNSRENRWQLFQESSKELRPPTGPQGFYRRQIYSMLRDTRAVFDRKFKNTNFACTPLASRPVMVNLATLGTTGFTASDAKNPDRQQIVKDIKTSWKAEGLEGKNVINLLDAIEQGTYGKYELTSQEALDLMTCLPIRRPWDIYGRLDAFQPDYRDLPPVKRNISHFTYKISIPDSRGPQAHCEKLLGYAVDLDFPKGNHAGPFYKFCRDIDPKNQKKREAQWYAYYGHLVDEIQFGLAASENYKKETFVSAYPLRICGWDHYLTLYIRPLDGRDATATDLTNDLAAAESKYKESHLGMTILKECWREFLVQIRIAAFQGYVSDEILNS